MKLTEEHRNIVRRYVAGIKANALYGRSLTNEEKLALISTSFWCLSFDPQFPDEPKPTDEELCKAAAFIQLGDVELEDIRIIRDAIKQTKCNTLQKRR